MNDIKKDTIGEVGNISIASSATSLAALVNKKVYISPPDVDICTWDSLCKEEDKPCVIMYIPFTSGIEGNSVCILKENDAKMITDLMMGGFGMVSMEDDLNEMHLSAIAEAMNQMVGASATAMASIINEKVDMGIPNVKVLSLEKEDSELFNDYKGCEVIKVSFNIEIEDSLKCKMYQLYTTKLAEDLYDRISA